MFTCRAGSDIKLPKNRIRQIQSKIKLKYQYKKGRINAMKYTVKCQKLRPDAKLPTKGSQYANAYDLYAVSDAMINPGETVKVGTGIAMQPPRYHAGFIFARSGLATQNGLRPANCVGLCDQDYTGEYIVPLHNDSKEVQYIVKGERIAQVAFIKTLDAEIIEAESLEQTARAGAGFGSTGK